MNPSSIGIIGGIIGSIIGLMGGIYGTYVSIKNTKTPEEKSLMVKMSVFIWLAMIFLMGLPLLLSLLGIIPKWSPFVGLSIFWCIMTPVIIWGNKKQAELRQGQEMKAE